MLPSEITLHIGLQKTATTLIQRSLRKLRASMAAEGVAYVDRAEVSSLPALRGWRAFRHPAESTPDMSPSMPAVVMHQPDLVDDFTAQLRALALGRCEDVAKLRGDAPRHLLMSNETLTGAQAPDFGEVYRPRAEASLQHVFEALTPHKVNLILYVRRQDTLLESQYMERIHAGEVHDFDDFSRRATSEPFIKFANLVERLSGLDRVAEVRVRPFEIVGAGPARFLGDLLAPLGLNLDLSTIAGQKANPSYTAPALEAALVLNPLIENRDQLRMTRASLRRTFPVGKYPKPQLFGDGQRRHVLDMYDGSNREFFATYVPEARPDAYAGDEATATLVDLI